MCTASYLTITAGTVNCPILGGLGPSLHLLRRELGSLMSLRMALSEHQVPIMAGWHEASCAIRNFADNIPHMTGAGN